MKRYYYAGGQRIAMRQGSSTLYFLLTDHLGSTAITATSSGGRDAELRYYPWGGTRYTYGTTPTSYRYTGQREAEVGLYYYGARFYDPQLGRFASPDTVIPQQQGTQAWDRYAYVNNSPIKYADPTGNTVDGDCHSTGFNCEDYTWSQNDWEEHGVHFSGSNWGFHRRMSDAVSSLNKVRDVLGYSRMESLLGLDTADGLTLASYTNSSSYNATSGCPDNRSCYDHGTNTIHYDPGSSNTTWVHEIGHAVDWHAGGGNFFSTGNPPGTGEWAETVGWSYLGNDSWSLDTRNLGGYTTNYATDNPREDFAETFTWYIYSQTGIAPSGYTRPNPIRIEVLLDSLNR